MSSPFQRAFSSKSPLNEIKISQKELNRLSAKQDAESLASSTSGNVGAPGDPGTEINYSDPKKFAGDDEGMLKSGLGTPEGTIVENDFEQQFAGDDGYEDQDLKKKLKA
jgi:hypothetical protein